MLRPKIKICCISSREEARMAINAGAWALGLVAEMPSGQGPISDELIADILANLHAPVETFLLTSRVEADAIIDHHAFCPSTTIQMVDHVSHSDLKKIRKALPEIKLVQVIHVIDEQTIEEAKQVAPLVDMILLDSGKPHAAKRTLGGTGDTHDWDISRQIRREIGIPMFLAGGLNPDNVAAAISHVQPFGVDLCSRIRTDNRLDPVKLKAFFGAVSAAR